MRLARSLTLTVAVLVSALAGSPAHASTTFTPDGGPEVNLVGTGVSLTVVPSGLLIDCSSSGLAGSVDDPGLSRNHGDLGVAIDSPTLAGCLNPVVGPTTVTSSGAWDMTVTGDATGTIWPVQLAEIQLDVVMPGCAFTVAGSVDGTFDTVAQQLTPTGSSMTVASWPVGFTCTILDPMYGDDVVLDGSWTNIPPTGSGSLTLTAP